MPKEIYGTTSDELLVGTTQDDTIYGEDGNDTLYGGPGSDLLVGGGGDDVLDGMTFPHRPPFGTVWTDEADTLIGGSGNDWLRGGAGGDTLFGGSGNDTASYYLSPTGVSVSLLTGYAGGGHADGDQLYQIENLSGSNYGDNLSGDNGKNVIDGDGGDDLIFGFGGADKLNGGSGDDWLYGGDDNDQLDGGLGDDDLFGHSGDDRLTGGSGADHLDGGAGYDIASYYASTAAVTIDLSVSLATGGHATGDDLVSIEGLFGSQHDDHLSGDGADNWLDGSGGTDILKGNGGADTFHFSPSGTGLGPDADTIVDFSQAQGDKIELHGFKDGGKWAGFLDFEFIGGNAFTGQEGEVHFAQVGSDTWISGDTDGDAIADFQIKCNGTINFTANDFIL
jgi:Ca2+-binding RTX toxin-like protein